MSFPTAPLDRATRLVTFAFVTLFGVGAGVGAATSGAPGPAAASVLFGMAVIVLAFGWAPASYETGPGLLRVHRRLFGSKDFVLEGGASRVPWRIGAGSIRLLGSGGVWGWYGLFWRKGLGRFHVYVTDRSRMVACQTADGRAVLVSPADPDSFLQAVGGSV